jgi:hypothetical protein
MGPNPEWGPPTGGARSIALAYPRGGLARRLNPCRHVDAPPRREVLVLIESLRLASGADDLLSLELGRGRH